MILQSKRLPGSIWRTKSHARNTKPLSDDEVETTYILANFAHPRYKLLK